MSTQDADRADAVRATNEWNRTIIEEFRSNQGVLGGNFAGAPVLLLHTTGAKSGVERVNPMMYLNDNGRIYVFASKAGADAHPDWYHNLRAHPQVSVEVGTEHYDATARDVEGDERARIYAEQASRFSGFADYQAKTSRVIPVVELVRQ